MKWILILLLSLLNLALHGETAITLKEAEQSGRVVLFGDVNNIRVKAGTGEKVIAALPAGYEMTRFETTETETELNGIKRPWLGVSGKTPDGKEIKGYLWGGLAAEFYQTIDLDGDGRNEQLLIARSFNANSAKPTGYEIRIVRSGKILARQFFDLYDTQKIEGFDSSDMQSYKMISGIWLGSKKFRDPLAFLSLKFSYEHSAYPGDAELILVFRKLSVIAMVPLANYGGEAYSQHYSLLWPENQGGRKDSLLIHYDCQNWEGPGTDSVACVIDRTWVYAGGEFMQKNAE